MTTNKVVAAAIRACDEQAFKPLNAAFKAAFEVDGLRGVIQTSEDLGNEARASTRFDRT